MSEFSAQNEWLEVSIETTPAGIDPISARIISLDIEGLQIEDYDEFLGILEEARPSWDYVDEELIRSKQKPTQIKVYLRADDEGRAKLRELRAALETLRSDVPELDLGTLTVTVNGICEEDWANNWKQYYKPTPVGSRLLILPRWKERPETDRVVFLNDPGMSFGTGTHASTRLALEAVERLTESGMRVLDLGCGSGILAVCALLLGAGEAELVDIDPAAARIAMQNAALNGVEGRAHADAGDVLHDTRLRAALEASAPYDLVLANIVADVIIPLAPLAARLAAPEAHFVTSGIIEPRLPDVLAALEAAGFTENRVSRAEGWCSVDSARPR